MNAAYDSLSLQIFPDRDQELLLVVGHRLASCQIPATEEVQRYDDMFR